VKHALSSSLATVFTSAAVFSAAVSSAAVISAAVLGTGAALAEPARPTVIDEQFIGPLPPTADVEAAALALPDELAAEDPAAEQAELLPPTETRSWLKEEAAAPAKAASDGNGFTALALVILLALGGAALYLKQRRGEQKEVRVASTLRVLSQVRVGPKANLVTVAVSGRVMLLGVTETNVANLGFIGEDAEDATPGAAPDNVLSLERAGVSRERFEQELDQSLSRSVSFAGNPEVASLLVEKSDDVVLNTRPVRAAPKPKAKALAVKETRAARVEDQVLGLLRRRKS
jgi:flagellar biogenesis protein FliO